MFRQDWFQDCCENWFIDQVFCFMVAKKYVMVTMSFKAQTTRNLKKKKRLS